MKRSNRLVLLIGIFLALVAFVLIALTLGGGGTPQEPVAPTTANVVVAARDLPLGAKITADAVRTKEIPIGDRPGDSFADTSFVIGQTARMAVTADQLITSRVISGSSGSVDAIEVPAGKVGIAVQVDQVSGVGTLTRPGDHVDLLASLTGDKFPVVTLNPDDGSIVVVSGLNSTSAKLLLQGMQVLATLLPPPPPDTGNNPNASPATGPSTALTGQQQIVILAVDAQQAEVIKYAQVDGSISLVLRSAEDFRDPQTGLPLDPSLIVPAQTTGVTLKGLVDEYGILVPELVEAILPRQPINP